MLSIRTKIILQLSILAVIVIGIGSLIFLVAFRAPQIPEEPTPTPPLEEVGALPSAGQFELPEPRRPSREEEELPVSEIAVGGPVLTVQLTSSAITSPTLVNGAQISYYDGRDGRFYTIDNNGNVVALSDAQFPQADVVTFAQTGEIVALEFPDGSNVLYNFATETQTTLPAHWEDFAFSRDASQVASKSIAIDPDNRALVLMSSDGSRTQAIAGLGENENKVTVQFSPGGEVVAFAETGSAQSAFGREEIYLIGTDGDAIASLIVDGSNFSGLWSPDGTHLLYSVANAAEDERPTLWYTKASGTDIGSGRINLNVETWVEKCTFKDAANIYCAVPREMIDFGGFDHRLVTAPDDIYQINLVNGRRSLIGAPVTDMQMSNLQITDDGSLLFFTDKYGRLNSMRLR